MPHEVSEFIVVAPSEMGRAIQWAEPLLQSYLEAHFPLYRFRIEPFGPFADEDEFTVLPIINRAPDPFDVTSPHDATFICHLDPTVIPEIQHALRAFDPVGSQIH
ncbi:MAG: hypothetical protein ACOH2N_14975 [Devosia sp.]